MRDSAKALWLSAALLLPGCSTRPESISGTETFTGLGDHAVFVVSHGWHTGIVMPAELLTGENPQLRRGFLPSRGDHLRQRGHGCALADQLGRACRRGAGLTNKLLHQQ